MIDLAVNKEIQNLAREWDAPRMPDANGPAQPVYFQNRVRYDAVILLERGDVAGDIIAAGRSFGDPLRETQAALFRGAIKEGRNAR